jgi:flavodoxin/NAD-dependent dihydropyrimidine dehydrogenase PreA subunit
VKSIVVYFSQTGNTEKVGKAIAAGIEQVTGQCDATEIRKVSPRGLKDYDLIGIGSPVFGQCPDNVLEFGRQLKFVGGKHAFAFCTHGTSPKRFYPFLYPVLKARGLVLLGNADWYGDCFLLHMPQPYPTVGHPDDIDLAEAEEFGREMALRSMRVTAGETDLIPPPAEAPPPMYALAGGGPAPSVPPSGAGPAYGGPPPAGAGPIPGGPPAGMPPAGGPPAGGPPAGMPPAGGPPAGGPPPGMPPAGGPPAGMPPAGGPPAGMPPAGGPPAGGPLPNGLDSFANMLAFDREICLHPKCTLCMDNCPVYGIDLSVDPPLIAQPCVDCEFCARICPTGALDMLSWLQAMEEMTVGFMPKMMESLNKAEAEGKFRRLIPMSEVDLSHTGYRQYTNHPQWVLGKGAQKDPG